MTFNKSTNHLKIKVPFCLKGRQTPSGCTEQAVMSTAVTGDVIPALSSQSYLSLCNRTSKIRLPKSTFHIPKLRGMGKHLKPQ